MILLDPLITFLQQLPPFGVLAMIFIIAYIENLFPPSPSDVLIVFGGVLVGIGTIQFWPAWAAATAGSSMGFVTAYGLGRFFGDYIKKGRGGRWVPSTVLEKVEKWFRRFGYAVIIINRFLMGTRAVVSFVAGLSRLHFGITTLLCALSAGVWNAGLLFGGVMFGKKWRIVADYLALYGRAMSIVLGILFLIWGLWYFLRKKKRFYPNKGH